MFRFIFSILLILGISATAIGIEGGNPANYLGLTAFLISFFTPVAAVLGVWKLKDWGRAFTHAFARSLAPGEGKTSLALWGFYETTAYLSGILGFLTGGVLILGSLGSSLPWNHALGACLIAPLYGLFFGLVGKILKARVENRLN